LSGRPQLSEYSEDGPSNYDRAMTAWRKERIEQMEDILEGLWAWDQVLMRHADTFSDFQAMRRGRLSHAARYIAANVARPE